MSAPPRFFDDWPAVRDALEHAYAQLGLEMVQREPGLREYPAEHWNIAGIVRDFVLRERASAEVCMTCKATLTFANVIRCLDCRAQLCECCAGVHFGGGHKQRAAAAH